MAPPYADYFPQVPWALPQYAAAAPVPMPPFGYSLQQSPMFEAPQDWQAPPTPQPQGAPPPFLPITPQPAAPTQPGQGGGAPALPQSEGFWRWLQRQDPHDVALAAAAMGYGMRDPGVAINWAMSMREGRERRAQQAREMEFQREKLAVDKEQSKLAQEQRDYALIDRAQRDLQSLGVADIPPVPPDSRMWKGYLQTLHDMTGEAQRVKRDEDMTLKYATSVAGGKLNWENLPGDFRKRNPALEGKFRELQSERDQFNSLNLGFRKLQKEYLTARTSLVRAYTPEKKAQISAFDEIIDIVTRTIDNTITQLNKPDMIAIDPLGIKEELKSNLRQGLIQLIDLQNRRAKVTGGKVPPLPDVLEGFLTQGGEQTVEPTKPAQPAPPAPDEGKAEILGLLGE